MKVGIVGVGGVGRTLAQLLRAEAAIDALLLIDKEENRARFFTKLMGRGEGAGSPLCFQSPLGHPPLLEGWAGVADSAPPAVHPAVMDARLPGGARYTA